MVLDSGTTFSYLPTEAYQGFLQLLEAHVKAKGLQRVAGPDPRVRCCSWCWLGSNRVHVHDGCCTAVMSRSYRNHFVFVTYSFFYILVPLGSENHIIQNHSLPTPTSAGAGPPPSSRPTA